MFVKQNERFLHLHLDFFSITVDLCFQQDEKQKVLVALICWC